MREESDKFGGLVSDPATDTIMINTERLILRQLTTADRAWVNELYGDPTVTSGFGRNAFSTSELKQKMKQLLGSWAKQGLCQSLVIDKVSKEVADLDGIRPTNTSRISEISYAFRTIWWGKGVASEAAQAWVRWGLDDLNLDAIIADNIKNLDSVRVLEKAGFCNHP